jgi:multiple sugar transport system permease protein
MAKKIGFFDSTLTQESQFALLSYHVVAIILSLVLAFPVFWMVSTAFKTESEANAPKPVWLPAQPSMQAFERIASEWDLWGRILLNSIFVTSLAVFGTLISVTAVAYAFSRLEWPGRDILFYLMLGTLMLPIQTTMVPLYVLYNWLGWINTFNPITIPGFFAGGASMIFLLRQFMMSIPKELDEAALLDGASPLRVFVDVILPLCRPAMVTVGVFLFVGAWNSLQFPLIYLQDRNLQTLPMAIYRLYSPQQSTQPWPYIMATSFFAVLPLVVAYVSAQRYFTESIVLTGGK